jgi:hypothetical protein
MNLYNCEIKRKSEVIENCKDNSFIIVSENPMENYDNVTHLVAFIIGNNIYNVCNSGDHSAALNCLKEKYGIENVVVLFLEKGKHWRIHYVDNSLEHLNIIKEFLLSIKNNLVDDSTIYVDSINSNVQEKRFNKEDFNTLIGQLKIAINKAEEEEKEKIVNEIANQIVERKKHTFMESAKRFLCGK